MESRTAAVIVVPSTSSDFPMSISLIYSISDLKFKTECIPTEHMEWVLPLGQSLFQNIKVSYICLVVVGEHSLEEFLDTTDCLKGFIDLTKTPKGYELIWLCTPIMLKLLSLKRINKWIENSVSVLGTDQVLNRIMGEGIDIPSRVINTIRNEYDPNI